MSSEIIVNPKEIDSIADKLSEYFFDNLNDFLLFKIISRYDVSDVDDFFKYFKENYENYFNKKEYVITLIKENIREFDKINIIGFLKFRMWNYNNLILKISKEIYEDYLAHIKYKKLISLMKVVIKNAETIVYHLNIEVNEKNIFEFYDDNFNNITSICVNEFIEEYGGTDFSGGDLLLGTVLTLAPKIITLYNIQKIKNKEIIGTLKMLYEENLILV